MGPTFKQLAIIALPVAGIGLLAMAGLSLGYGLALVPTHRGPRRRRSPAAVVAAALMAASGIALIVAMSPAALALLRTGLSLN
ncbi:hypothetical protein GSY69_13740 [Brevibacterium sp. 5221]|uniref:Uncharacterized protein n=1 Tax=Brevibacterium rongguiense TaxID=2695267 RepID=A0A6N9HAE4_9MICO|nr:hypothetical protein [Brevibacterium rongguiense]MYM20989.1 hypothetical protein [Brevibacterium rongguiense]